jgi:hypothetical protein
MIHRNHLLRNPAIYDNQNYGDISSHDDLVNTLGIKPDEPNAYYNGHPAHEAPLVNSPPQVATAIGSSPKYSQGELIYHLDQRPYYGAMQDKLISRFPKDLVNVPVDYVSEVELNEPSVANLDKIFELIAYYTWKQRYTSNGGKIADNHDAYYDPTLQFYTGKINALKHQDEVMEDELIRTGVLADHTHVYSRKAPIENNPELDDSEYQVIPISPTTQHAGNAEAERESSRFVSEYDANKDPHDKDCDKKKKRLGKTK